LSYLFQPLRLPASGPNNKDRDTARALQAERQSEETDEKEKEINSFI
jgi:hypothetical protein